MCTYQRAKANGIQAFLPQPTLEAHSLLSSFLVLFHRQQQSTVLENSEESLVQIFISCPKMMSPEDDVKFIKYSFIVLSDGVITGSDLFLQTSKCPARKKIWTLLWKPTQSHHHRYSLSKEFSCCSLYLAWSMWGSRSESSLLPLIASKNYFFSSENLWLSFI